MEVQAWGHLGTASFATVGDRATGTGGESPLVLDQGCDLLCTPSALCEGTGRQSPVTCPILPGPSSPSLFSFPRSLPGQHWGLAGPQPTCPPDILLSPMWSWRTLLLLRSFQHKTGLTEGEPGMGHGPTELPWSGKLGLQ